MIAYLILAHRYPDQFKRMFKSIYHPNNHYLIHIDKRSEPYIHNEIQDFIRQYSNVRILESKNALWGGYSLVDAELRGIKELLSMNEDWEFFINLSAQDFPLQSQKDIQNYLQQYKGTDFIKVADQEKIRPDTLHRIENYVSEIGDEIISEPAIKRDFLKDITPYIGNQWMILSRKFCDFVTFAPEVDKFKTFYANTLIADEGFFQTVIMNTSYKSNIINDDKRAIDWIPMGDIKLRPRDFTAQDFAYLTNSGNLFARKFDETIDLEILDLLDKHITKTNSNILKI